jgi:hypothetical protein
MFAGGQIRILYFGLPKDRDIRVRVFPESKEIPVCG